MGNEVSKSVLEAVAELSAALQDVQQQLDSAHMEIKEVSLEMKMHVTLDAGGNVDLKLLPIKIEGNISSSEIQTYAMTFSPYKEVRKMAIGSELKLFVNTLSEIGRQTASLRHGLDLKEATLTLDFGITGGGGFEFFFKAGGEKGYTHQMAITLQQKAAR